MYTSPVINTQAIYDRQAATLQNTASNIVQPVSTGKVTFLDKINNVLNQAVPIVYNTQNIVSSLQNRVPGTSIPYSQQYQQQQFLRQQQQRSMVQPVLIGGALILAGYLIYKAVK